MKRAIILSFLFTFLFSDTVSFERASLIAQNFTNARINSFNLVSVETVEENARVYFYIFRLQDRGFIIVSANDSAMPVLAYSFNNIFDTNLPVQVEYLLNTYKDNIDLIIDNNINSTLEISNLWELYSSPFEYEQDRDVSPLLT